MSDVIKYLKYGILAVLSSATIGTTLWFDRSDNKILPQDMIELKQGVIERMMACQWRQKEINVWGVDNSGTILQYYDLYKTGEDSQKYYVTVGTNPVQRNYSTIDARLSGTSSNFNWWTHDVFINPWFYNGSFKIYDYTNRFLVGVYSNINVTGFIDDGINGDNTIYNGAYYYVATINDGNLFNPTPKQWLLYRHSGSHTVGQNIQEMVMNADQTQFWTGTYYGTNYYDFPYYYHDVYSKPFVPWVKRPFVLDPGFGPPYTNDNVVCTQSNLDTNRLVDSPIWTETPYNGQFIGNNLNKWAEDLGTIDGLMLGIVSLSYMHAPTCMVAALLYPPCYFPDKTNTQYSYAYPWFIEPSNYGISEYDNKYDLQIDRVGLWNTMGATNKLWFYDTLEYVAFDDLKIVPFSFIEQRMKTVQGRYALSKKMLDQRYQAIKKCKTTFAGGSFYNIPKNPRWVHAYENNAIHMRGRGATMAECLDNLIQINSGSGTIDGSPYCQVSIQNRGTGNGYEVHLYSKACKLEAQYVYGEITNRVSFYARAGYPNGWTNPSNNTTYAHAVFDSNGEDLTFNKYVKFDALTTGVRTNAMSTGWLGDSNPENIANSMTLPTISGHYEWAGWQITDEDTMIDWDFSYCK